MGMGVVKGTLVFIVKAPEIWRLTKPVVAPGGTRVLTSKGEIAENNRALVLRNLTRVVSAKDDPRIMTDDQAFAPVGTVSTKALRPSSKLKTVPGLNASSVGVSPNRSPLVL
jgi:hypothetical protein